MNDLSARLLAAVALALPALAQTSLTTVYTAGNSLNSPGSVMWNATVLNANGLVVTGFDVNCENTRNGPVGSVFQVDVYLTALGGTYVGNEANPAAWKLVATGTSVSLATGTPTFVDTSDFFLPSGRFGMALNFVIPTGQLGTAYAYTNGNTTNQSFADAHLQLDLGSASTGVFTGAVYTPRVWNGSIYYEAGTQAAYGPYGTGCDGGSPVGAPTLRPNVTNGVPRLGGTFEQLIGNLGSVPDVGIMVFGQSFQTWAGLSLPLNLQMFGMPGCLAYIPPDAQTFFVHVGSGSEVFTANLPNSPGFAGLVLGTQVFMLDPATTNPLGASITNLCAGRIGT